MNAQAVTNRFPDYEHTQQGKLYLLFVPSVLAALGLAFALRHNPAAMAMAAGFALLMLVVTGMFRTLTVRDEGDHLLVQFGPIPSFRKRIAYDQITAVEPAKSRWIDGWGIHYVPRDGWIWNLWGFDCARLTVGGSTLRVGSDDVENLVTFLKSQIERNGNSAA